MLPIAFAIAAEKSVEASYAIYLYCAGAAAVVGGGAWWYSSKNQTTPPENSTETTCSAAVPNHQEELREEADAAHRQMQEHAERITTQRSAQQATIEECICGLKNTVERSSEITTLLNNTVMTLQTLANSTEIDVKTIQSTLPILLDELTKTLSALNQSQKTMEALEKKLQQPINNLKINSEQLAIQLIEANQEIEQLRALHQRTDSFSHDERADLNDKINRLSVTNIALTTSLSRMIQFNKEQQIPQEQTPSVDRSSSCH